MLVAVLGLISAAQADDPFQRPLGEVEEGTARLKS